MSQLKMLRRGVVVMVVIMVLFQCDVAQGGGPKPKHKGKLVYTIPWAPYPNFTRIYNAYPMKGDVVEFKNKTHLSYAVARVDENGYAYCSASPKYRIGGIAFTGHDKFTLVAGFNYFISDNTDLCSGKGMILAVKADTLS